MSFRIGSKCGKIAFNQSEADAAQILAIPLVEHAGEIPFQKNLALKFFLGERVIPYQVGIHGNVINGFEHWCRS